MDGLPALTARTGELGILPSRFVFEAVPASAFATLQATTSIGQLVHDLHPDRSRDTLARSMYLPTALVQGIIEHAPDDTVVALKTAATRLALGAFAGIEHHDVYADLTDLLLHGNLMDALVDIDIDDTSARATAPALSQNSAERIQAKTNNALLMVAICNGGFAAAIQTSLYLRRANPAANTTLYPVRFSRNKRDDETPYLVPRELTHLGGEAVGKTIMIHDDDAPSGATLAIACETFKGQFPQNEVLGIVNQDGGAFYRSGPLGFGEWWERA